jgi:hypothetical protein
VSRQARRVAPRASRRATRRPHTHRSAPWLLDTTLRRTRAQWQLLLGVVAVATLASVLVTTLSLLVVATEQGGCCIPPPPSPTAGRW